MKNNIKPADSDSQEAGGRKAKPQPAQADISDWMVFFITYSPNNKIRAEKDLPNESLKIF
jgi:hypothetical protein